MEEGNLEVEGDSGIVRKDLWHGTEMGDGNEGEAAKHLVDHTETLTTLGALGVHAGNERVHAACLVPTNDEGVAGSKEPPGEEQSPNDLGTTDAEGRKLRPLKLSSSTLRCTTPLVIGVATEGPHEDGTEKDFCAHIERLGPTTNNFAIPGIAAANAIHHAFNMVIRFDRPKLAAEKVAHEFMGDCATRSGHAKDGLSHLGVAGAGGSTEHEEGDDRGDHGDGETEEEEGPSVGSRTDVRSTADGGYGADDFVEDTSGDSSSDGGREVTSSQLEGGTEVDLAM